MVSSFPKMQKSSASFSQSIRNRLRLKNLQAQAKNFCRVLDIRVTEIMYPDSFYPTFLTATIHLVGKIIFRNRENSVIWLQAVILFKKVLHLVA